MASTPGLIKEGKWMWVTSHHWDLHHLFAIFRTVVELEQLPTEAPLQITADQSYQLYINGEYVCSGPARGYQDEWPYDELDIRGYLRPGKNCFAIRAYHPGTSNFRYISQSYAGVLFSADLGECKLTSGEHWRGRRQTGVRRDTIPTSLQLFFQEHVDLNEESPEWMQAEFDDSSWDEPIVTLPWNARPWTGLQPRGIPMLEERMVEPLCIIGFASGPGDPSACSTRDVCLTRYREGMAHKAAIEAGGAIHFEGISENCYQSALVDFGRTVVGSPVVMVDKAAGGEIIDISCYERIDPHTLEPVYKPAAHSKMAFGNRIVCRSGAQRHEFYHPFGFRYAMVTVRRSSMPLKVTVAVRSAIYPLEERGSFCSSNEKLNAIWRACAWTQRVCSLDAFVDTPWREQAQWWGDARIQARNTFFFSGDTRLFRRGIAQIAKQRAGQLTYGHAPTMAHGCVLPDFTLVWLLTLWDFYWQTGSLEPIESHRKVMLSALSYFSEQTCERTGLLRFDPRYWLFLDWAELYREGYSATYNLLYLYTLQKMQELLRLQHGNEALLAVLSERSERLTTAVGAFFNDDGVIADGLDTSCKRVSQISVHAQTLAILTGIDPGRDAIRLEQVVLPFIRENHRNHITPSCYWISYVFEVLNYRGYGQEVIRFIEKHWAKMADHGTTWEVFEPRLGEESFSHAWSAHPLFHLMELVGGVRQAEVGWKKVHFAPPVPVGLHAKVKYPTPLGIITSEWKKEAGCIHGELTIPKGITALIALPDYNGSVEGKGSPWSYSFSEALLKQPN